MNGNENCEDRGPRIGSDGAPRCRRPKGHDGDHRPAAGDGWGDVRWSNLTRPVTAPLPPDPAEVTDGDRAKATDLASMVPAFGFVDAADAIAAAIAAERAAVTRPVLALQEELAQRAADFRWAQTGSYDSGVNDAFNHVADRLRRALAGPDDARQDGVG